ncbi:hypothetical protein KC19_11G095800 [Ceratodon purpureus]|uniref:Uncharacterized protein n=1 Tax=Ceratodon purpureus TaxID=3225 RepID=A0A8T0GCB2_CERPU|nr:hypothetical protein KC19_11G095800 [Ceratodon purpureus]
MSGCLLYWICYGVGRVGGCDVGQNSISKILIAWANKGVISGDPCLGRGGYQRCTGDVNGRETVLVFLEAIVLMLQ